MTWTDAFLYFSGFWAGYAVFGAFVMAWKMGPSTGDINWEKVGGYATFQIMKIAFAAFFLLAAKIA